MPQPMFAGTANVLENAASLCLHKVAVITDTPMLNYRNW